MSYLRGCSIVNLTKHCKLNQLIYSLLKVYKSPTINLSDVN